MRRVPLGLIAGGLLGLLDGLSAYFVPEARDILTMIIVSATLKGLITGSLIGFAARKIEGAGKNTLAGGGIGLLLSLLAAIPTGPYVEIVVPGTIIGLLLGSHSFEMGRIVSKWSAPQHTGRILQM